jgi:uncharacterized cupin superfamily protein
MADPHLIHAGQVDWAVAPRGRHPFNPASEMQMVRLGDMSGMKRVFTNLIRLPPGKESFIPHAHSAEEEMVYVLEGTGEVVLDGVRHAIGPGDYLGFPIDGVVHSVVNTGDGPLTYLSVGERARMEVADMPSIGKTAIFRPGRITMVGGGEVEELTPQDWAARTVIDQAPKSSSSGRPKADPGDPS